MASFLASAAKAGSNNLSIYLKLIQEEEHQKRVEQLQAKRDQVDQQRWEKDRADTNAYRDKQLGLKKSELKAVREDTLSKKYDNLKVQREKKIAAIDKETQKLIANSTNPEQIKKVKAEMAAKKAGVMVAYDEQATPLYNKLVSLNYYDKLNTNESPVLLARPINPVDDSSSTTIASNTNEPPAPPAPPSPPPRPTVTNNDNKNNDAFTLTFNKPLPPSAKSKALGFTYGGAAPMYVNKNPI